MARDFSKKLHAALSEIDRPGTFCCSGSVAPVLPGLEVDGIGPISLPLVTLWESGSAEYDGGGSRYRGYDDDGEDDDACEYAMGKIAGTPKIEVDRRERASRRKRPKKG